MWGALEWLVVTPHLALVAAGVAVLTAARTASLRPPEHARAAAPARDLDPDELAYLAGGPHRVVETAVARLLRLGALEVRPGARVRRRAAEIPPGLDPLTRRVLDHADREASLARILTVHASDPEVGAVRHRLAAAGLRGDPDAARHRELATWWLTGICRAAEAGCVLIFGGLIVGIARTGAPPVSFGVLGVAIAAAVVLRLLRVAADPVPEPRYRTPAGLRALADARRAQKAGSRERRVALGGLAADSGVPLGWRASWWRWRGVLRRLAPVAAATVVIVVMLWVVLPLA